MVKVSIVIPTSDRPIFLENALCSISNQSFDDYEIIVVDDGKKGIGKTIVEKYKDTFNLTYLNNNSPHGASFSRNVGAAAAKGEFIAFLDDDDWWDSLFLEKLLFLIEKEQADIAAASFWNVDHYGKVRPGKLAPRFLVKDDFYSRNPGITGSNFLIKKEIFKKTGGFDKSLPTSNDMDFVIRLCDAVTNLRYCSTTQRLVYKRNHCENQLTTFNKLKVYGTIKFFNKYKNRLNPRIRKRKEAKIYCLLFVHNFKHKKNLVIKYLCSSILLSPLDALYYLLKYFKI